MRLRSNTGAGQPVALIMTRIIVTHGHRLGQNKAQTGFEGSQEARALDEEVAIASTPSELDERETLTRFE